MLQGIFEIFGPGYRNMPLGDTRLKDNPPPTLISAENSSTVPSQIGWNTLPVYLTEYTYVLHTSSLARRLNKQHIVCTKIDKTCTLLRHPHNASRRSYKFCVVCHGGLTYTVAWLAGFAPDCEVGGVGFKIRAQN